MDLQTCRKPALGRNAGPACVARVKMVRASTARDKSARAPRRDRSARGVPGSSRAAGPAGPRARARRCCFPALPERCGAHRRATATARPALLPSTLPLPQFPPRRAAGSRGHDVACALLFRTGVVDRGGCVLSRSGEPGLRARRPLVSPGRARGPAKRGGGPP
jgi:hypothetical protein